MRLAGDSTGSRLGVELGVIQLDPSIASGRSVMRLGRSKSIPMQPAPGHEAGRYRIVCNVMVEKCMVNGHRNKNAFFSRL